MKHLRIFMASIMVLSGLGGLVLIPSAVAAASPQSEVCQTLGSNSGCTSTPSNGIDLTDTVAAVVNIISIIAGIAAVIMIIVSGLRMITANGDANTVSSARSGILYSIIGLVVVAFAQFIVYFVLDKIKS